MVSGYDRIRLFRVPRPRAKHVWGAIFVGVLAYNSTAEDGDLLSEQVDLWLETNPILTRVIIAVLAAHLANLVSPQYDVISFGFMAVRKVGWRRRSAQWMAVAEVIANEDCVASTTGTRQLAGFPFRRDAKSMREFPSSARFRTAK